MTALTALVDYSIPILIGVAIGYSFIQGFKTGGRL